MIYTALDPTLEGLEEWLSSLHKRMTNPGNPVLVIAYAIAEDETLLFLWSFLGIILLV